MQDTTLIRKILFYILITTTLILIYIMFFPRKSYVETKINNELNPIISEVFNQNINSMYIASSIFFEKNNKSEKVTLNELIKEELLVELKDSNNELCDQNESYIIKKENSLSINLKCPNKQDTINKITSEEKKEKLFCIYQYKKTTNSDYSAWSEFSSWQLEEIKSDELTNVETKKEQVVDGTKIITNTKEINIDANIKTSIICPNNYIAVDGKCKKETYLNTIQASITYTCPNGYKRTGMTCYGSNNNIPAEKKYYCSNYNNLELKLNGNQCDVYRINYIGATTSTTYYECPSDYQLSGNKCYKTEYYEEEVTNYKEVIYYRYQTRTKIENKYEIRFSKPNDNILIDKGFIQEKEIMCEI